MNICYSFLQNALSETHEVSAHRKDRAERIQEKALSCQAIRDLYELAKNTPGLYGKTGAISLEFAEKLSIPESSKSWGEYIFEERRICLKDDISDDKALTTYVYELTNAVNTPRHLKNQSDVANFSIDCETYAKESERIEFEGIIKHHEVIEAAIAEKGWDKSLHLWKEYRIEDFEQRWGSAIKQSGHADVYRKDALGYRIKKVVSVMLGGFVAFASLNAVSQFIF